MTTLKEIKKFIIDTIEDVTAVDSIEYDKDTTLSDLDMDSLDIIELIMECEKEFNIIVYDNDYENDPILIDIINLINSKVNG